MHAVDHRVRVLALPIAITRAELVTLLESKFLPPMKRCAAELRRRHPNWQVFIRSAAVGSNTTFQAHSVCIECRLPGQAEDISDNLALDVTFSHLDGRPRLMADVCWGHPQGYQELALPFSGTSSEQWPLLNEQTLAQVESLLPDLFLALGNAMARGRPPTVP